MGEVTRVVVVGGEDGLATRVLRRLRVSGRDVSVVVDSAEHAAAVATGGVRPAVAALDDRVALTRVLRGADALVQLGPGLPDGDTLARACADAGVAVHVVESTTDVYAGAVHELDEDAPVDDGGSARLAAALAAERCAGRVASAGGRAVILRVAAMYGHDVTSSVELASMLMRRRYAMVGGAREYRPAVQADDAAAAVELALSAPSGTYNVVDATPRSWREQLAAIAGALDAPPVRRRPRFMGRALRGEAWTWESRSQRVSGARLGAVAGWTPAVRDSTVGWPDMVARWRTGTASAR